MYDFVNRGVKEGNSTAEEIRWMERKMGNHEARTEDNHRDIYELMGTIGYMKKDLHKLVGMNQCSHYQTSPARDHPMEETLISQPEKSPWDK